MIFTELTSCSQGWGVWTFGAKPENSTRKCLVLYQWSVRKWEEMMLYIVVIVGAPLNLIPVPEGSDPLLWGASVSLSQHKIRADNIIRGTRPIGSGDTKTHFSMIMTPSSTSAPMSPLHQPGCQSHNTTRSQARLRISLAGNQRKILFFFVFMRLLCNNIRSLYYS